MATERAQTILVVDDEETIRRLSARRLGEEGYRVVTAEDGDAALVLERSLERVDLLIADLVTPGRSGFEVAEILRARRPLLPVIYVTGYAASAAAQERLGPKTALLLKPFSLDDLVAQVRELLGAA
jgi:CheY-like chemotaxis protein